MCQGLVRGLLVCAALVAGMSSAVAQQTWQPAQGPLMTRWAAQVTPRNVLPEYPRPQLTRPRWLNLNGLWDYAIRPRGDDRPAAFDGTILVPFAVESALSGVMKPVGETQRLWYRRTFQLPTTWSGDRILLHFGAVDFEAFVFVNGKQVGTHQGGNVPFSFDITDALNPAAEQEIVVAVWDPTDSGHQPRGKQVSRPSGIWYTAVTGIWQTVWIEPVAPVSIEALHLVPDVDAGTLTVDVSLRGSAQDVTIQATALDGATRLAAASVNAGQPLKLNVANARHWTPDAPHLYDLKLSVLREGQVVDEVSSYFAMRKIALARDDKGILRLALNNQPLFQFGPLDQGWWPDGLYTAPTDEALKYDIQMTKEYGFNLARKHVKVEPSRWYYWCDKLGLLVWQDMPSGYAARPASRGAYQRPAESARQWEAELKAMIDALRNHPSIVMWVPFNEGWGQYDTQRITHWIKQYDPTRLVNNASGWTDQNVGDVRDLHNYPGPAAPPLEANRATVLGEFGGLGLPVAGHTWQNQANWGYRNYTSIDDTTAAYLDLVEKLHVLTGAPGLAAAVYTQTTDVEIEVNGLMTYDRTIKLDPQRIAAANRRVYTAPPPLPPVIREVIPASRRDPVEWQYTTVRPADNWFAPDFDAAGWLKGPAGFGTPETPNTVVRTRWTAADIWIRRSFDLPADLRFVNPHLLIYHDEDADIYIDGVPAARVTGYVTTYETVRISPQAARLLMPGTHVLAIHCRQTGGGQYIDAGIVDLVPASADR